MSRPIVLVTGANGGVGFGICQRLLLQMSLPNPPDMLPEPLVDPSYSQHTSEMTSPPSSFDSLTLVLVCRNNSRASKARDDLLVFLDAELLKRQREYRRQKTKNAEELIEYAKGFRERLVIEMVSCDLSRASSVLECCENVQSKYPYITHLFCNAGLGAFEGLAWLNLAYNFATNLVQAVTIPTFKKQTAGVTSDDGFGWVWQCNFFGHYLMVRNLQNLLSAAPASSKPARVMWTGTMDLLADSFDRSLNDWQLIESKYSYEHSKLECELVAARLNHPKYYKTTAARDGLEIRHFITHPGVTWTSVFAVLGAILDYVVVASFYVARFFGSPHHNISCIVGAHAAVHIALVPLLYLPQATDPISFGSESTLKRFGRNRGLKERVSATWSAAYGGNGPYFGAREGVVSPDDADLADRLIGKCDALCESLERREGKGLAASR